MFVFPNHRFIILKTREGLVSYIFILSLVLNILSGVEFLFKIIIWFSLCSVNFLKKDHIEAELECYSLLLT